MHGVNLDLLHLGPYHTDGRPKNPHAHHWAELLDARRTARKAVWRAAMARLRGLLAPRHAPGLPADRPF